MNWRVCLLLLSFGLRAEDFQLSQSGVGPIKIHTELTYEGKLVHLVATAENAGTVEIPYIRFCIKTEDKGCLFTLWNTTTWEPGGQLSWDLTSARRVKNLSHMVNIEVLNYNGRNELSSGGKPSKTPGPKGDKPKLD